jgi:hypothetical protein
LQRTRPKHQRWGRISYLGADTGCTRGRGSRAWRATALRPGERREGDGTGEEGGRKRRRRQREEEGKKGKRGCRCCCCCRREPAQPERPPSLSAAPLPPALRAAAPPRSAPPARPRVPAPHPSPRPAPPQCPGGGARRPRLLPQPADRAPRGQQPGWELESPSQPRPKRRSWGCSYPACSCRAFSREWSSSPTPTDISALSSGDNKPTFLMPF